MAAPVIQTITGTPTGSSTSHTVSLPAGIQSGDGLLLISGTRSCTVTTPSGWTQLYEINDATNGVANACLYRDADGLEGTTLAVTISTTLPAAWYAFRITGVDFGTTPPEAGTATSGTGSTTYDPPSVTHSGGTGDYVYITCNSHSVYTHNVSQYPTNFTGDNLSQESAAVASSSELAIATLTATGSSGTAYPNAFTWSTDRDDAGNTIAVRASGGGGGPTPPYTSITVTG